MLVSIIYHPRRTTPYLIELTRLLNESVIGVQEFKDYTLNASIVVNESQINAVAVVVARRYLTQTRVQNLQTFGAHVLRALDSIVQSRVVNENLVHNVALVITKHYLNPSRVVNTNTFGTPNVQFAGLDMAYGNDNGTGSREGTITVTTTAIAGGSSGPVTRLVNGVSNLSNATNAFWWTSGQTTREVKFDFATSRCIRQARWYQDTSDTHGVWQWKGSDDDSSYTNIGSTFTLGGVNGAQIHTTLIDNLVSYRYYKLVQVSGNTNDAPWLREIEFFIDGASAEEGDTWYGYPAGGGSFDNTIPAAGSGVDRNTVQVAFTLNKSATDGSSITNMQDGARNNNSTDSLAIADGHTDSIWTWEFVIPQRITAMTWAQQNGTAQGTYDVEVSHDGSSWTTLASAVAIVNGNSVNETTWTNTVAYKWFRLRQVGGTTSNSPWIQEIFWRCVPTVYDD